MYKIIDLCYDIYDTVMYRIIVSQKNYITRPEEPHHVIGSRAVDDTRRSPSGRSEPSKSC